ncbi:MAG TPA: hypothetical protein VG268_07350 [Streptosporangiaceae bacterium]|nr:hypothetical protein [Streptosporangiaceae bacterium]
MDVNPAEDPANGHGDGPEDGPGDYGHRYDVIDDAGARDEAVDRT